MRVSEARLGGDGGVRGPKSKAVDRMPLILISRAVSCQCTDDLACIHRVRMLEALSALCVVSEHLPCQAADERYLTGARTADKC